MSESVHEPLISVIMATYIGDRLEHLQEAVESILTQTYQHLELLVVVNGPVSREAEEFLASICERDLRVRLSRIETNCGPALARNHAITEASGEFFAILDADDFAEPTRLAKQLALITETSSDLVGACYFVMDANGTITGTKHVPLTHAGIVRTVCVVNPICNSTVFAHASVFREHAYPRSEYQGVTFGEDYALWVELLLSGKRLANHAEPLIRFRSTVDFLRKRGGMVMFVTDARTRLRATRLHGWLTRPVWACLAMVCTLSRLMPRPLLRFAYALRARFRFDAG